MHRTERTRASDTTSHGEISSETEHKNHGGVVVGALEVVGQDGNVQRDAAVRAFGVVCLIVRIPGQRVDTWRQNGLPEQRHMIIMRKGHVSHVTFN